MDIMSVVYIAIIAVALIGFIEGLIKGLFRSLVDVVFLAINGIASGITASVVGSKIVKPETLSEILSQIASRGSFDPATLDTINQMQTYLSSGDTNTTAVSLVVALVAVIILPLLFVICFIAYGIILVIPKLIIQFVFVHRPKSKTLRWSGAAICAISNIIAFAIFLMPIIGYVNYANDTVEQLKATEAEMSTAEEATQLEATADNILSITRPIKDNFLSKTVSAVGGEALFNSLTTIDVDDTRVSLKNETDCAIRLYGETSHFKAPFNEYGPEQIEAIESIEQIVDDAEFVPSLIANCLSYVTNEWDQGRAVFGMEKPKVGADFQESLDQIIHILAQTNEQNFKTDTHTIATILKACIEDEVIQKATSENPMEVVKVLEDTDVLSDVLLALHKNERFRPSIPHITNGVNNYIYKVYDEVNGTYTEPHQIIDYDSLTEEDVKAEGEKISLAIKEIDTFIASIEGIDVQNDMMTALVNGNFAALGRGCNQLRDSYLFKDTFDFLLEAILNSEACAQIGIIDDKFVENATKEGADLEKMLVTRQNLAILVVALKDGNEEQYDSAIEIVITEISKGEGESLKSILTYSNLRSMGLSKEKSKTISGLLTSMIVSVDGNTYTDAEKAEEAQATGKIFNAVNSALENKENASNVFNTSDDAGDGVSNITAEEFVDTAIKSDLVSSMIESAITSDEGEIVDDPYNIHDKLSSSDLDSIENALVCEYNKEGIKDDPEAVKKLENIAHIVGIDVSDLFQ